MAGAGGGGNSRRWRQRRRRQRRGPGRRRRGGEEGRRGARSAREAAQEKEDAARQAAKEKAQAEEAAAEAARKQDEARQKAAAQAAKRAAQAAAAAAKARETWDRRGRPKKLIIIRPNTIDTITDGRLSNSTAALRRRRRSTPCAGSCPARSSPSNGDTAKLNAAVVLTPQRTLDISGVKTLQLGGGDSPTEAAFLYTGSGRILVKGVTVTSVNKDGQPLAMSAQGRPYIVVSARGRFEATDATLSDLGVQPTGTDKGDPGISFNTGSTGALVRTQLLRNTTGAELSGSANIRLEDVTASESWSDGLLLQGDQGTTMSGIKAERNGGNGVTVTGESSERRSPASRPRATTPTASR